jgi:signal transduction histidine kinase
MPSDFCRKSIDSDIQEAHNQTTGRPVRRGLPPRSRSGRMNSIFAPVSARRQEAFLDRMDLTPPQISDSEATRLEEMAHDLRQPLGAIEALAYFLEITTEDEQVCGRLQRIQAMVLQANRILDRCCATATDAA